MTIDEHCQVILALIKRNGVAPETYEVEPEEWTRLREELEARLSAEGRLMRAVERPLRNFLLCGVPVVMKIPAEFPLQLR